MEKIYLLVVVELEAELEFGHIVSRKRQKAYRIGDYFQIVAQAVEPKLMKLGLVVDCIFRSCMNIIVYPIEYRYRIFVSKMP